MSLEEVKLYLILNRNNFNKEFYISDRGYEYHLDYYQIILDSLNFVCDSDLKLERDLPFELSKQGFVIFENIGSISKEYRQCLNGCFREAAIYLPLEIEKVQRDLLISKIEKLDMTYFYVARYNGEIFEYEDMINDELLSLIQNQSIVKKKKFVS